MPTLREAKEMEEETRKVAYKRKKKKRKKKKKVEAGSYFKSRRKGYEQMLEDAGKI